MILILAGVSIVTLTGDNGLLSQVQNANTTSKIAEIEEQANLIYTAELIDRLSGQTSTELDLAVVCTELQDTTKYNYDIQLKTTDAPTVTEILLNPTAISIAQGDDTKSIEATPVVTEPTGSWYAVVDGKYYRIYIPEGKKQVKIDRTSTDVNGEGATQQVTFTSNNNKVVFNATETTTATVDCDAKGKATVVISVGEDATNSATVTALAGNETAECVVTVLKNVTAISAEAITVEEGKIKQIVVATTPTGNDVEALTYTYESNDTAIATVDLTGKVTGVVAGSTTITITGTNENDKTVTTNCAITVTEPMWYGTQVTTGVTSVNGQSLEDNWKIFYADANYVYLIYGDYYPANVQTEIISGDYSTIYIPAHTYNSSTSKYDTDSTYTYSVNSDTNKNTLLRYLKNNTGYDYTSYTTNKNYDSIGVASEAANRYESWKNLLTAFQNGNKLAKKATSVQGSPTFEMWVDSWNEKYNETDGKVAKLKTFVKGGDQYGYLIGDTSTTPTTTLSNTVGDSIKGTGYYDTLYYPYRTGQTTAYGYWLSSSGGHDALNVCNIYCNGSVFCGFAYKSNFRSVRPVVSIPKSDFNANNLEGITID